MIFHEIATKEMLFKVFTLDQENLRKSVCHLVSLVNIFSICNVWKKHFKWCLKWSTKRTKTCGLSYICRKCIKKIIPFCCVSFTFLDLLFNLHCQIHSKRHQKLDWRILWYMSWASWWWQVRIFSQLSKQMKKAYRVIYLQI